MPTLLTYPGLITQPFAGNALGPNYGGKNAIPIASASPLASMADGFPAVTMLPSSGGGVPPAGKDFNGVFYFITAFQTWVNAGGRFKYDSALSTAISGYPAGAVIMLNDNVSEVVCLVSGTITDPNTNMAGWAPFSGALAEAGFYQLDTGAVNAYVIARSPTITSYTNGMPIKFKAIHTNTGASTINAGPSAVPIKRNDGAALVAGDIVTGTVYSAVYDLPTTSFWLISLVKSQLPVPFSAVSTPVRALGTTYTNNTGLPIFVSVTVTSAAPGFLLNGIVGATTVVSMSSAQATAKYNIYFVVPPGSTYSAVSTGGDTLSIWAETN